MERIAAGRGATTEVVRVEPRRRADSRRRNGRCRLRLRADREAPLVLRALRARGLRPRAGPQQVVERARRRSLQRPRDRRLEQGGGRRADSRDASRRGPQLGRPALQRPDLRRVLRVGGHVPRHGDDALRAAPDEPVRGGRGQARRLPVRARGGVGGERAARPRRHRGRAGRRRCLRPLRGGRALLRDPRGRRPRRREPHGRGLRLRADLLHLDDDRGVPEPARRLGEGARLVHDAAVLRAGGLRLPRGHRAGRVRQRGARGGAPRPALDRVRARHVQVRARRRVHRAC